MKMVVCICVFIAVAACGRNEEQVPSTAAVSDLDQCRLQRHGGDSLEGAVALAARSESGPGDASSATSPLYLRPVQDTWAHLVGAASWKDDDKSCELRVNRLLPLDATRVPQPAVSLLKFDVVPPPGEKCENIKLGLLALRAGQHPSPGSSLNVYAFKVTSHWGVLDNNQYSCTQCQLSSVNSNPFDFPSVSLTGPGVLVDKPCPAAYVWNITQKVKDWCNDPASNFGIVLAGDGGAGDGIVNFHSVHALSGDRPLLYVSF
jgi:hypothetical protein